MYPTDPRQLNTERQIYLDKQFFVDVFSIPACVRNTNGDFIGYNEKFSKEFIGSLDIKEWFYSLPVQVATSFLREELDAMSLPSSMNKIQSVAIGDKLWLVQFIPLIYGEVVNVLWLFLSFSNALRAVRLSVPAEMRAYVERLQAGASGGWVRSASQARSPPAPCVYAAHSGHVRSGRRITH